MYPIPATINTETSVKYTEPSTGKTVLDARLLIYTEHLPKRSLNGAEVYIHYDTEE
ncbi:hypothetical protein [Corynebacterium pseudodiphtheriticum]|uniref:hypothetical protein n=1 Tax=Corynebacterium pseudodiphtheriticum TaxID=37637 RepID=UPI0025428536|nr:hypothetical protein [Corynebacterium pseudodiphtheriticum]MDK4206948.1 hypothetical protein [Corynebacterium pseudodiphtheriticum]